MKKQVECEMARRVWMKLGTTVDASTRLSTNSKMNSNTWVGLLYSMSWETYDQFKDWLGSARILAHSQMLPPIFCSCKCSQKEYYCVHATGLMMMWDVRKVPLFIGKRRNKGRTKKEKYAMSKD